MNISTVMDVGTTGRSAVYFSARLRILVLDFFIYSSKC